MARKNFHLGSVGERRRGKGVYESVGAWALRSSWQLPSFQRRGDRATEAVRYRWEDVTINADRGSLARFLFP